MCGSFVTLARRAQAGNALNSRPIVAGDVKAAISLAAAVAAVAGLVSTDFMGVPHSLRLLHSEERRFAELTDVEREQAFGALIPVRMDIFDFYRRLLRDDDRFYVQVKPEPFGNADKATVVRSVARLYLAPAVEVERIQDATVVISWDTDPAALPLVYSKQDRAGLQLIFVSRVAR